jgi:hypothetical protein
MGGAREGTRRRASECQFTAHHKDQPGASPRGNRETTPRASQMRRLFAAINCPSVNPAWLRTRLLVKAAPRGRLVNRGRDKGTSWETQLVRFLQEYGWVHAERRARRGTRDAGDIAGVAGVCIEAKNEKRIALAEYLDETQIEKANAGAAVAACWIKRPRKTSPAHGNVVMSGAQFVQLLREAGY